MTSKDNITITTVLVTQHQARDPRLKALSALTS